MRRHLRKRLSLPCYTCELPLCIAQWVSVTLEDGQK